MGADDLNSLLRRVHAELGRAPQLDEESRGLLAVVAADIERLGHAAPATAPGLRALAVQFEAEHPAAAAALRQVGDLLGKAGI
ncbi:MAG: DUF4404 family protein [Proteobacteria bacterium]|nr:DUF4404 family protein [Pseudomonadota bacterium]